MSKWECNNCGEDKCTREGNFLQPINCTMYSWRKPKWKEVRNSQENIEPSNSAEAAKPNNRSDEIASHLMAHSRDDGMGEVIINAGEFYQAVKQLRTVR